MTTSQPAGIPAKKSERELLVAFKEACANLEDIKNAQKDAQAVKDKLETELVEYLTGIEADATAKYDGVGYGKMSKPKVYASCNADNKEALKAYLLKAGREDLIKEDVSAPALSGFVGELLEQGKPAPAMVSYYLKTSVRIY